MDTKIIKKVLSVLMMAVFLTTNIVVVGCGMYEISTETKSGKTEKPKIIWIDVEYEMITHSAGALEFEEYLEGVLREYGEHGDIDLVFVRPYQKGYEYKVMQTFSSYDWPDVMLLTPDKYVLYAANNMLWDMSQAWEKSIANQSGGVSDSSKEVISQLRVTNAGGQKGLYGITPVRGRGCCTYIKEDWLKKAGISRNVIEGKSLTFDEYYGLLKTLKSFSKSEYVISPPGYISMEEPYTHYLPEFYQNAHFSFYKNETGKYVDGFAEQAMMEALIRIRKAVADGIVNARAANNTWVSASDYFCQTDVNKEAGVITYWAGENIERFSNIMNGRIQSDGTVMSGELVALNPIKEIGGYVETIPYVWCITSNCENPEGVFKYFIDTMLDGGEIQKAWQYGAKGIHWDDDTTEFTVNHIDPMFSLFPIKNDPGYESKPAKEKESVEFFKKNSKVQESIPITEELDMYREDINRIRVDIVNRMVTDVTYTVEQARTDYQNRTGEKVQKVLESLNYIVE